MKLLGKVIWFAVFAFFVFSFFASKDREVDKPLTDRQIQYLMENTTVEEFDKALDKYKENK